MGGKQLVYKDVFGSNNPKGSNLILKTENPKTVNDFSGQRGIIVGFDPGLTVGIAILDLEGNILSIRSFKEISMAEIIKYIINYGKTVLVATDVYPAPKTVKKLASSLNSKINSPYRSMSVESKIELVKDYIAEKSSADRSKVVYSDEVPQNDHERDAFAAAIKTYNDYKGKLGQIEKRTEGLNFSPYDVDNVKIMVINDVPITSAIKSVLKIKKAPKEAEAYELVDEDVAVEEENRNDATISKLKQRIKTQTKQLNTLKLKNTQLQEDIADYEAEVSKFESKIDKLYYEYSRDILYKKEVASKVQIIKRLQERYKQEKARRCELERNLNALESTRKLELSKNVLPVKIIESFTKEGIRRACEYWKIKRNDVVLLANSKGGGSQTASLLISMGIKAVITTDKMSHQAREEFEKNRVPVLDAKRMNLEMIDEFAIIKAETLKDEIESWKKVMETKTMKEDRKKLLKIIDEYRAKRKRSNEQ